jgi:CRISPR/Cas system CMR-associated protein Cmr3 (group 5 of RAMP superfamily)
MSHPKCLLLPSHTLLVASLAEKIIYLLLSSNVISNKTILYLRLEDLTVLKLALCCSAGSSYRVVNSWTFQPQKQKDFFCSVSAAI